MKINEHDWKLRISNVFQSAIDGQLPQDVLDSLLDAHVYKDLMGKHDNGLPVYSDSTQKYVLGLIAQGYRRLSDDHLEYCFLTDGVLYSTHKNSTHRLASTTRNIFDYRTGGLYWKGSSTAFDAAYKKIEGGLVRPAMPNSGERSTK